ncbi:MAG: hypothetical protein GY716_24350 [bacterium]|nr:hypothetical protein [bacterium]
MPRPQTAPPLSFFDAPRSRCGDGRFGIELGGIRITLEGLAPEVEQQLRERYGVYVSDDSADGGLRVECFEEDSQYFIDPPERPELNPILLACDGTRVRYLGYRVAGWFDTVDGRGKLLLARGTYEPADRAIENYVRAAVAWQAASRGGALIHAASAVRNGRGYLFYGESGAGKSTLSACNLRASVVSDDLSLVLPGGDSTLELVGSPFRGTYEGGDPVVGRFPLHAGFRIVKADVAEVKSVARSRALAELVGNLPFVAEAFDARPDLFERIEIAFRPIPLGHLLFRKDDSYWDAIDRAGL